MGKRVNMELMRYVCDSDGDRICLGSKMKFQSSFNIFLAKVGNSVILS